MPSAEITSYMPNFTGLIPPSKPDIPSQKSGWGNFQRLPGVRAEIPRTPFPHSF
jgi:hypothetical protein